MSETPVAARAMSSTALWTDWIRALRVHQWSKNLLIIVPLFTGHAYADPANLIKVSLAFVALCLLASVTYILNDLSDLDADRRHPTKRMRPFASGRLKPAHGLIVAPVVILGTLVGAYILSPAFFRGLLAYLLLTVAYSLILKRIPLVDVFMIGVLFTLRIVMGAEVANLTHSPWLLSFALAFFLSLALAKRHGEVMLADNNAGEIVGRGYRGSDWPITLTFGVGTGLVSVVIMLLYMTNDAAASGFYRNPAALYAIPALLTLWLMRIWLFSHRTQLHDDPVIFALKDRTSLALGLVVVILFYCAI